MSDENFIEELQRKRQEALVRQIASRSFLDAKSSKNFACAAASCLPTKLLLLCSGRVKFCFDSSASRKIYTYFTCKEVIFITKLLLVLGLSDF